MSDLDVLLRESLGRLAEPGDPTGVVEAVRARVEAAGSGGGDSAGDGGSGATGAGGGGAGAAGTGFWGGWAPLGILIGLSVAGGAGLALALQPDAPSTSAYAPLSLPGEFGVPAALCPGGETVALLDPGARLVAVARTEDGGSVAVRNPRALDSLVWIALSAAEPDAGADVEALPISGCEESGPIVPIVTEASPEPVPGPDPAPAPGPNPGPQPGPGPAPGPSDTQNPTIQVGNWSPDEIYDAANPHPECTESTSISVFVGDNVGVTNVTWSAPSGVSVSATGQSGNTWTFSASVSGSPSSGSNTRTVTFRAHDAAGNQSPGAGASFLVWGSGMCVF